VSYQERFALEIIAVCCAYSIYGSLITAFITAPWTSY